MGNIGSRLIRPRICDLIPRERSPNPACFNPTLYLLKFLDLYLRAVFTVRRTWGAPNAAIYQQAPI